MEISVTEESVAKALAVLEEYREVVLRGLDAESTTRGVLREILQTMRVETSLEKALRGA